MTIDIGHQALLFVPGDRPERYAKASGSGADAVILDLEDAVGEDAKPVARASLATDFTELPVIVRINAVETRWYKEDLARVQNVKPSAVMLPKSQDVETMNKVVASLGDNIPVIALIESALGLSNARAIAASSGVTRLAFGSIDFCADLGCSHDQDALLMARSELVLASRLAELLAPIDGVTTNLKDTGKTFADAQYGQRLGMGGKLCIHPMQVAEVKRAFAPSTADIKWAKKVLASGDNAISVDGAMVDKPVRLRALSILSAVKTR